MSGAVFAVAAYHREIAEKSGADWRSGKGCSCSNCRHVRSALDHVAATGWVPPAPAIVPDTKNEEAWR